MFNFSFNHSMGEIRELAGPDVILVGNIPPRDVLAGGTPDRCEAAVKKAFGEISDHNSIIWSAGGGMPPDVSNDKYQSIYQCCKKIFKIIMHEKITFCI